MVKSNVKSFLAIEITKNRKSKKENLWIFKKKLRKRRTFAIISHPDAGKTTITEQLLYFGGEIREAGTVKGKKTGTFAKSDWMDIEKQRGDFGDLICDAVWLRW